MLPRDSIIIIKATMAEKKASTDDDLAEASSNKRQDVNQVGGDGSGVGESSDVVLVVPSAKRRLAEFPFPIKLHIVLHEIEDQGLSSIMSWQPDGKCFMIHKTKDVVGSILSRWFRQQSIGSFQRQLNLYDFKRIKTGKDKGAYFHELFHRDNRKLAYGIKRVNLKTYKHDVVAAGAIVEPRMMRSNESMVLGLTSFPARPPSHPQPFAFLNTCQSSQLKITPGQQDDDGGVHGLFNIPQHMMEQKQRTSIPLSFPTQVPGGTNFNALGDSSNATDQTPEQNTSMNWGRRSDDSNNSLATQRGLLSSLEAASSPTDSQPQPRHLRPSLSSDTALLQPISTPNFGPDHHQRNLQQGQENLSLLLDPVSQQQQAQGSPFRVSVDLFSPDVQDDIIETFLPYRDA